jgi:mannitol/fructose-specific phosphotransferase system IIA component
MLAFRYLGRTDEARIPMPLGWGVSKSLVWCIPGIHKEPVQNLNQLTSAKTVIATIDRLTDAKTGDGLLQLLGYGREIIIRVVVAWI